MIDERVKALIHAALDGELSDAERAELDQQLQRSEQARLFEAGLKRLDQTLRDLPPAPMPEQLHEQIVARISVPRRPAKARSLIRWLSPALRYGFATAAGLLVAVGLYEFEQWPGNASDLDRMAGTLAPPPGDAAVIVDEYAFERTELSSSARLQRRDGALVLDVEIDSEYPVEFGVSLDGDAFSFGALEHSGGDFDRFEFSRRSIQANGRGRQGFTVFLDRVDGPDEGMEAAIRLEFSGRGGLIDERVLVPDL